LVGVATSAAIAALATPSGIASAAINSIDLRENGKSMLPPVDYPLSL
jgi:hypothetical protein